jgi:two-component system, NtrC family, sensor kinase
VNDHAGRIVVVDDSWIILEQIRLALNGRGYEVRTTTGADVAAKLAKSSDLAIVDFHMPGMNGGELLGIIRRSLPSGTACLFYLYTSDPAAAARYALHGFDGAFLHKGDEAALGPQVDAVFRTIRLRKLADQMRRDRRA